MTRLLMAMAFSMFAPLGLAEDGDWSRFRGPNGTGISHATTVPVKWTEQDYNWKVTLPGVGRSSPIVCGDRIYITSADPKTAKRFFLCLATTDGREIWRREFESTTYRQHGANAYASATPVGDADGVVVTWTTPDEVVLLAFDRDGKTQWRRDLGPFVGDRGSAVSPIIVDDMVVLPNDQANPNLLPENQHRTEPITRIGKSFLIAVDRKTGKTRWKTERRTGIAVYSTPCVYPREDGGRELIFTNTLHGITAIDPATGKVNWELPGLLPERVVASPVFGGGLIFASFGRSTVGTAEVAIRPSNNKATVAYKIQKAIPLVPTPIVKDNRLYLWTDAGIVSAVDVPTGKTLWRERIGGSFLGSPVCVGDHLYCVSKKGEVVVLAAGEKFAEVARVPLNQPAYSTPAIAQGVMYLRTDSQLYSLGGPRK